MIHPIVNFINVIRTNFSYKHCFLLLHVRRKNDVLMKNSYVKCWWNWHQIIPNRRFVSWSRSRLPRRCLSRSWDWSLEARAWPRWTSPSSGLRRWQCRSHANNIHEWEVLVRPINKTIDWLTLSRKCLVQDWANSGPTKRTLMLINSIFK